MLQINFIDATGVLSPTDVARLKCFIIDNCLCGAADLKMLRHVALRDDGPSGYASYWTVRYMFDGIDAGDIQAVIMLNAFYLKTMTRLEKALAHEFGHHWTLGYLMVRRELIGRFDGQAAPDRYYRIRGLNRETFAGDCGNGWAYCDKEVLAEDYKYFFSPYGGEHCMAHLLSPPTTEVGEFIRSLGEAL